MIKYVERFAEWIFGTSNSEEPDPERPYEPIWLSRPLAERSQAYLRSFCSEEDGREGIVYWAGVQKGKGGVVTTLVVPDADAGPGYVSTTPGENAGVITEIVDLDLVLLGQVHSHPPGAGKTHSPGDDEMTFSPFEGAVSVVTADYARGEVPDSWGVHRFVEGRYQKVSYAQADDHLRIVPGDRDRRE